MLQDLLFFFINLVKFILGGNDFELGRWIYQLIQAYHQYGVRSCPAL